MKTFKKFELVAETVHNYDGDALKTPKMAADLIKPFYGNTINTVERMYAIYVDTSLQPLGVQMIGQGGFAATHVDPKIIYKGAVDSCARGVFLSHNHPTGQLKASNADHNITETVKKGLETLGMELFDHVIVTENGYTTV